MTSGIIDMLPQDNETGFTFRGDHFDIGGGEVYWDPIEGCDPCTPGAMVSLSATITPRVFPPGGATIDGHTYDNVYFSGKFKVKAGSVTVPDVAPGEYEWPATWFTFKGNLAGYADSTLSGEPLFKTRLRGAGTASLGFFHDALGGVTVDAFRYEFANAAPTPEPGTLLLFAPGAAWIARQWRRRRHAAA